MTDFDSIIAFILSNGTDHDSIVERCGDETNTWDSDVIQEFIEWADRKGLYRGVDTGTLPRLDEIQTKGAEGYLTELRRSLATEMLEKAAHDAARAKR